MAESRPNPDQLLASVQAQEAAARRGKLKVFFGACAGVGKTYAMLEAARKRSREGFEVVVGIVETHGRKETEALLEGLEIQAPRWHEYRGARLREFDLEGALRRRPTLLLVDELAHTNVPGSTHAKRWQDIQDLLEAGIDVYTTVNVQHIESQNDVVAQITGISIRETVPDKVLEQATEIEVVDIPPEELIRRFQEGRIYIPEQADLATRNFFKTGNLIALRQLALRVTADRVERQMEAYRKAEAIREPWPVAERILVCVGPSPQSAHVIRAAKRLSTRLHAEWIAVYIELSRQAARSQADRERILKNLALAEHLGAETVTLGGQNLPDAIIGYARERNATRVVIGKPVSRTWRDLLCGSQVDQLARRSGDVDIFVIRGEASEGTEEPLRIPRRTSPWSAYAHSLLSVAGCTVVARLLLGYVNPVNLAMLYLATVVFVATRYGRGPSVLASFLSVTAFDIFLIPPYLSFAVADVQYLITFAALLFSALVISDLAGRVRAQAQSAAERERRTAALYGLSRLLATSADQAAILYSAGRQIADLLRGEVVFWLPGKGDRIVPQGRSDLAENEVGTAQWAFDHKQRAGMGTATLPGARYLYLPLQVANRALGVLGFRPSGTETGAVEFLLLETLATLTAQALEREKLSQQTNIQRVEMETERLRNALLSSVSHDLRTPLAGIKAASSLLASAPDLDAVLREELIQGIHDEADYINRLVGNLLEMTRLEAGAVNVKKEPQPLEEVVGAVTGLLEPRLRDHPLAVRIPENLPMIPMDAVLIQQVLFNLLENAIKYTPPESPIELSALPGGIEVVVEVADRGPGLKSGEEGRIFHKFYRAHADTKRGGVGLGLTICKGIVTIHGGRIWAENRPGGGAVFRFTLPIDGQPATGGGGQDVS